MNGFNCNGSCEKCRDVDPIVAARKADLAKKEAQLAATMASSARHRQDILNVHRQTLEVRALIVQRKAEAAAAAQNFAGPAQTRARHHE